MTRQLRDTLSEWADEVHVPHDLADRALRRRARWRPWAMGTLAVGMAAVVAVVLAVAMPGNRTTTVRPAVRVTPTDIRMDTENSPPKQLIAAGGWAVSAYWKQVRKPADGRPLERAWWLYNPVADTYEQTPWAWVDVAPGLQTAAVLDGELLGRRVGILDMNTRQITSWIDLPQDAGSVAWSPDGTQLLATTYSSYPDMWVGEGGQRTLSNDGSPRTGYALIDVATGKVTQQPLPPLSVGLQNGGQPSNMNNRQDLDWSLDGKLIYGYTDSIPDKVFYTLDGKQVDPPADQLYKDYTNRSAVSPDGRLVLGQDGLPTKVTERATGAEAGRQNVLQLLAWADSEHLIALGCAGECKDEFHNGLVLVSVDGKEATQLAVMQKGDTGRWQYVLTPR